MIAMAPDYQTPSRMAAKMEAVRLPNLCGKRVLDVGTDMGAWARLAADLGASEVLGLDRNRVVRGQKVDLIALNREQQIPNCRFEHIEIGKQYRVFGNFDVVLCLSVYHHLFEASGGDHRPIWFWLWCHARLSRSVLLWEGPVDTTDPVVRANVSPAYHQAYTRQAILAGAAPWFDATFVGPALHEPTREVWRFTPKDGPAYATTAVVQCGSGGATVAFEYAAGRRMDEIELVLGHRPVPGSLNLMLDRSFDWDTGYFRAQILDVKTRAMGFDSGWSHRWMRFYPVRIDGEDGYAMRFEGENYDDRFMEVIAPWRLRDVINGPDVRVTRLW